MSIKVAVRLRPFNQKEIDSNESLCVEFSEQSVRISNQKKDKTYTFDHCFWSMDTPNPKTTPPVASQEDVYNQIGGDLLPKVFQGLNCCIFAYGQTGSGKTFSMTGSKKNPGVIPRLVDGLFAKIAENTTQTKSFEVHFSMLEIYNEKINDLLIDVNNRKKDKMEVKENPKKKSFFVVGLQTVPVGTSEDVMGLYRRGVKNKSIASTQMNQKSSRAHTLVTLDVKISEDAEGQTSERTSRVHLIDLAGSENVNKSKVRGSDLRESCHINKSLSCLGRVISVLAKNERARSRGRAITQAPPFRDSVLTKLLKNALGGNSVTYMLCTLSPALGNFAESLSTLRYANQAKDIRCKPVVNESRVERQLRLLKKENEALKRQNGELVDRNQHLKAENDKLLEKRGGVEFVEPSMKGEEGLEEVVTNDTYTCGSLEKPQETPILEVGKSQNTFDIHSLVTPNHILDCQSKSDMRFLRKTKTDPQHKMTCALININEDPMLTGKYELDLEELSEVRITNKTNWEHWTPNMIMCDGPFIREDHASISWDGAKALLRLKHLDSLGHRGQIILNGQAVEAPEVDLVHRDVIIIGKVKMFVFREKGRSIETLPDFEVCMSPFRKRRSTLFEALPTEESEGDSFDKDDQINLQGSDQSTLNGVSKETPELVKHKIPVEQPKQELTLLDTGSWGYRYQPLPKTQSNTLNAKDLTSVFLGRAQLRVASESRISGDVPLQCKYSTRFNLMVEIESSGSRLKFKLGKLRRGWVRVKDYFVELTCFKDEQLVRKTKSRVLRIPSKRKSRTTTKRSDVFSEVFENVFQEKTLDKDPKERIERDNCVLRLVIEVFGVKKKEKGLLSNGMDSASHVSSQSRLVDVVSNQEKKCCRFC